MRAKQKEREREEKIGHKDQTIQKHLDGDAVAAISKPREGRRQRWHVDDKPSCAVDASRDGTVIWWCQQHKRGKRERTRNNADKHK